VLFEFGYRFLKISPTHLPSLLKEGIDKKGTGLEHLSRKTP